MEGLSRAQTINMHQLGHEQRFGPIDHAGIVGPGYNYIGYIPVLYLVLVYITLPHSTYVVSVYSCLSMRCSTQTGGELTRVETQSGL
jgi:hypothetical protein